jgi:hypothetical protein
MPKLPGGRERSVLAGLWNEPQRRSPGPSPETRGSKSTSNAALDVSPSDEGAGEGRFVRVFDVSANRHSERQSRGADVTLLQQSREIKSRRLTLDVRVGGENDLFDTFESLEQSRNPDLVGTDASLRRESAKEDVVQTTVLTRSLDRLDVERLLDDTDLGGVAARVRAKLARIDVGDRETCRAVKELFLDVDQRSCEGFRLGSVRFDDVMRQTGRCLRSDAGKSRELPDEAREWSGHVIRDPGCRDHRPFRALLRRPSVRHR